MSKNPTLTQALNITRLEAQTLYRHDDEVRVAGISTDFDTQRSFLLHVKTEHGEDIVAVVAKKDTHSFHQHRGGEPNADRVLVKLRCVRLDRCKDKTRNVPVRKDGTLKSTTLSRAMSETVQLLKDDLAYRREREAAEVEADRLQQVTLEEIETAFPDTFTRRDGPHGMLDAYGHVRIPGTGTVDECMMSVRVEARGNVKLELGHLAREDALDLLERILRPDGWTPEPDTRRAHERFPEQFEEVPGQPGTFKYKGKPMKKLEVQGK